jgi:hypothetical protein
MISKDFSPGPIRYVFPDGYYNGSGTSWENLLNRMKRLLSIKLIRKREDVVRLEMKTTLSLKTLT